MTAGSAGLGPLADMWYLPGRRSPGIRGVLVGMAVPLLAGLLCALFMPRAAIAVETLDLITHAPNPLTETWVFDINPERQLPQYDFGGSLRVRYVDSRNVLALGAEPDPHRRFFRIRSRLWADRWFTPGWRLFAVINNESRSYLECDACESRFGEIIFENLFVEYTNQKGNPLGLRIGRQDLFYGDGFVICDGTPLDGSRTAYVNGILLTTAIPDWSFDVFAVWNRKEDEWLPRINNRYTPLLEYNEFVGGLYVRGFKPDQAARPYTIDYYYIFDEEKTPERYATINTFGSRLVLSSSRIGAMGELAYQAGKDPESRFALADPNLAGSQSVSAYGGQAGVDIHPCARVPLTLSGGYIHLSGDNPMTRNKFEGWNPLMGRWPKWSELYIYTLSMAAGVQPMGQGAAYWQNLKAPLIGIAVVPCPNVRLEARHAWMCADTGVPLDPTTPPDQEPLRPKDRGNLLVLRLSWSVKTALPLGGHVLYERFDPGGYYGPDAKPATFFRLEVSTSL
jgi:hypothetical protein